MPPRPIFLQRRKPRLPDPVLALALALCLIAGALLGYFGV